MLLICSAFAASEVPLSSEWAKSAAVVVLYFLRLRPPRAMPSDENSPRASIRPRNLVFELRGLPLELSRLPVEAFDRLFNRHFARYSAGHCRTITQVPDVGIRDVAHLWRSPLERASESNSIVTPACRYCATVNHRNGRKFLGLSRWKILWKKARKRTLSAT